MGLNKKSLITNGYEWIGKGCFHKGFGLVFNEKGEPFSCYPNDSGRCYYKGEYVGAVKNTKELEILKKQCQRQ